MTQTTATSTTDGTDFETLADKLDQADAPAADGVSQIDLDHILRLLSNERRRVALAAIAEHGTIRKSRLADLVAARLAGTDPDDVDRDFRKTVYVTLHQDHLPKLADHDVVRDDDGAFSLGANADQVVDILGRIEQNQAVLDAVGNALGRVTKAFRS
jgi:hypothetical protein